MRSEHSPSKTDFVFSTRRQTTRNGENLPKEKEEEEFESIKRLKGRQWKVTVRYKQKILESTTGYDIWLREQEALEVFARDELEQINQEEHEKWLRAERVSQRQWEELQQKIERARLERAEQDIRIRKEWEEEQKKIKETQERLKKIEEQNRRNRELFLEKLELFVSGDSDTLPEELTASRESKPSTDKCPFFLKTGCCRFGDACSRNHVYPGVSKVLLATNLYTQFGMDLSNDEQGSDIVLESDDAETYREFKEFFYDVLPEFERWGEVVQFKVCNNYEKHLRGNTYVEYAQLRSAVAAYRALHARWYAGRQLCLQFCNVGSWQNAVCGMYLGHRCPKGRSCNFLHVFKTPDHMFDRRGSSSRRTKSRTTRDKENTRHWRWSESPEPDTKNKSRDSCRSRESERSRSRRGEYSRRRSRSHSRERKKRRDREYDRSNRSSTRSRRSSAKNISN